MGPLKSIQGYPKMFLPPDQFHSHRWKPNFKHSEIGIDFYTEFVGETGQDPIMSPVCSGTEYRFSDCEKRIQGYCNPYELWSVTCGIGKVHADRCFQHVVAYAKEQKVTEETRKH